MKSCKTCSPYQEESNIFIIRDEKLRPREFYTNFICSNDTHLLGSFNGPEPSGPESTLRK